MGDCGSGLLFGQGIRKGLSKPFSMIKRTFSHVSIIKRTTDLAMNEISPNPCVYLGCIWMGNHGESLVFVGSCDNPKSRRAAEKSRPF